MVEDYVLEEPVEPPLPPSQTALRGLVLPFWPLFLLKLLRTQWMIGGNLWFHIYEIIRHK
jgi:hypothetical protein